MPSTRSSKISSIVTTSYWATEYSEFRDLRFDHNPYVYARGATACYVILSDHSMTCIRLSYIPGWDCHGLPIENKVLKKLQVSESLVPMDPPAKRVQKNAEDLSPQTIRAEAEKFAKEEVATQRDQFRQFGIMADWSAQSTYRTMGA